MINFSKFWTCIRGRSEHERGTNRVKRMTRCLLRSLATRGGRCPPIYSESTSKICFVMKMSEKYTAKLNRSFKNY